MWVLLFRRWVVTGTYVRGVFVLRSIRYFVQSSITSYFPSSDCRSHMITLIVLSRAFVCACVARRWECSVLATMPGCMVMGETEQRRRQSRPQLTMPLKQEQPDPGEQQKVIAAGWLLNSTRITTARSRRSAHAGRRGLNEPLDPGE